MITREKYFSIMSKVSNQIEPIMLSLISNHKKYLINEIYEIIYHHIKIRATSSRPKLRPFLFISSFIEKETQSLEFAYLSIAAILESINVSTYLSNLAFDKKGNCNNKKLAQKYTIASIILYDICLEAIYKLKELDVNLREKIATTLSNGYSDIMQGQFVDIMNSESKYSLKEFLPNYLKRAMYLGGASLETVFVIASQILGYSQEYLESLKMFGRFHGMSLQIINDVSDFMPITDAAISVGKSKNDYLSDLKQKKMTLPVFMLFSHKSRGGYKELLKLEELYGVDKHKKLLSIVRKYKIFDLSISFAYQADQIARSYIENIKISNKDVLESALNISVKNKFYKNIFSDEEINNIILQNEYIYLLNLYRDK